MYRFKNYWATVVLENSLSYFILAFVAGSGNKTTKGTEKRATKNVQLVLQHFRKTSWIAMSCVLPPIQNLSCNKSGCSLTGLNVFGKKHNIAIQLVLQQCCKTSCTFFVARFPYLNTSVTSTRLLKSLNCKLLQKYSISKHCKIIMETLFVFLNVQL